MTKKSYYAEVDGAYELFMEGENEVEALKSKFKTVEHIGLDDDISVSIYKCDGQLVHITEG